MVKATNAGGEARSIADVVVLQPQTQQMIHLPQVQIQVSTNRVTFLNPKLVQTLRNRSMSYLLLWVSARRPIHLYSFPLSSFKFSSSHARPPANTATTIWGGGPNRCQTVHVHINDGHHNICWSFIRNKYRRSRIDDGRNSNSNG